VLSFNACRITQLPDSIGDLKHLCYLDLSHTAIKSLPDSTATLYNLQTLILLECRSLIKLPTEIGNLTSLRHLYISGSRLKEMPNQIFRLENLQILSTFVVGKDGGSRIRDMRDMLQLQGSVIISGLENVVNFTDAMEANLKDKQELNQLVLQWSNVYEDSIDVVNEKEESKMQQILTIEKDISIGGYRRT
jgi:Leucine-rich repeat (LRR) protein